MYLFWLYYHWKQRTAKWSLPPSTHELSDISRQLWNGYSLGIVFASHVQGSGFEPQHHKTHEHPLPQIWNLELYCFYILCLNNVVDAVTSFLYCKHI